MTHQKGGKIPGPVHKILMTIYPLIPRSCRHCIVYLVTASLKYTNKYQNRLSNRVRYHWQCNLSFRKERRIYLKRKPFFLSYNGPNPFFLLLKLPQTKNRIGVALPLFFGWARLDCWLWYLRINRRWWNNGFNPLWIKIDCLLEAFY